MVDDELNPLIKKLKSIEGDIQHEMVAYRTRIEEAIRKENERIRIENERKERERLEKEMKAKENGKKLAGAKPVFKPVINNVPKTIGREGVHTITYRTLRKARIVNEDLIPSE